MTDELGISGSPLANLFIDVDNDMDLDLLFLETSDSSFIFVNDGKGNFEENLFLEYPLTH